MQEKIDDSFRIVVLGKTCAEKSFTRDILIGEERCNSTASTDTIMSKCLMTTFFFENEKYSIFDTPGNFDYKTGEQLLQEFESIMEITHPGPHVFIYVLDSNVLTQEDKIVIDLIAEFFGKHNENCILLFTGINEHDKLKFDEFLKESNDENVKQLIKSSNSLYLDVNNKELDTNKRKEFRKKAFEIIYKMANSSIEPGYYSIEKFELAKTQFQEKLRKIDSEREEEIKKMNELKREYDEKIEKVKADIDPLINESKKKWYEKLRSDLSNLFKR